MIEIKKCIPNLITFTNMYFGFLSIVFTVESQYMYSIILIIIGAILDLLDGYAARIFDAESMIGRQLDSFSDIITFGLAPSILFLFTHTIFNELITFIFVSVFLSAGAYRLARFNTDNNSESSFFIGVPITLAGLILSFFSVVNFYDNFFINVFSIIALSFLMISSFNIPNLKKVL